MKYSKKQCGALSFGQLMLVVLALGSIAVAALMYMLYATLTATPQNTAKQYEERQKEITTQIMTPGGNGKITISSPETASEPQNLPNTQTNPTAESVIHTGEPPVVYPSEPSKNNTVTQKTLEQLLPMPPETPTGLPGKELKPIPHNQAEIPLQPTNIPPLESATAPVPVKKPAPKRNNDQALDDLF